MPLPLGHAAFGVAIHDIHSRGRSPVKECKVLLFVVVLANLPDIDVLIGLAVYGDGNIFHRGATHSLVFAVGMALVASNIWRFWTKIPRMSFLLSFLIIFSHILADAVFTSTPVSLWWPLEIHRAAGQSGWWDVIYDVVCGGYRDAGIVLGSGLAIGLNRLVRHKPSPVTRSHPIKGR